MRRLLLFCIVLLIAPAALALGEKSWLAKSASSNLTLIDEKNTAELIIDSNEFPGVVRTAKNLQADIEKVSGKKPALHNLVDETNKEIVLIGTLGKNTLIDQL
ncbi:MAG: glycosyl hydrolase, partial [Cellvibrio sp.]|nr:glycosyl hydrolase [Cellvibrio sp.]